MYKWARPESRPKPWYCSLYLQLRVMKKKTKKEQMPIDNLIFTFIIWMHSFVTSNLPKGPAGK